MLLFRWEISGSATKNYYEAKFTDVVPGIAHHFALIKMRSKH